MFFYLHLILYTYVQIFDVMEKKWKNLQSKLDPILSKESVCMDFGSRSSRSDGSDCEVVQICQATIIKEASMLTKIIKVAKHVDGGLDGD